MVCYMLFYECINIRFYYIIYLSSFLIAQSLCFSPVFKTEATEKGINYARDIKDK